MRRVTPLQVFGLLAGLGLLWISVRYAYTFQTFIDFASFYRSGLAWRVGTPLYQFTPPQFPNLNPPSLIPLVFAPLSRLSLPAALTLWLLAGAGALVWSVRRVAIELRADAGAIAAMVIALLTLVPALVVWMEGQVTWLLLPFVVVAWAHGRAGRHVAAGLWLAPLIAIKPPFALFALLLPWQTWLVAGSCSAGLTLAGIGAMGLPVWREWVAFSGVITWLSEPSNASVWGLAIRITGARSLLALPRWVLASLSLCLSAGAIPIVRARVDRRWALAFVWLTLAAPLGWIYYLPLALGPLAALRIRWFLLLAFALPWPLLATLVPEASRSLYNVATLVLFAGLLLHRD